MRGSDAPGTLKVSLVIRTTALLSVFAVPLLAAAAPVGAQSLAVTPASAQTLLRFDTPGHQTAEITPVQYHRYRRHRRHYDHR